MTIFVQYVNYFLELINFFWKQKIFLEFSAGGIMFPANPGYLCLVNYVYLNPFWSGNYWRAHHIVSRILKARIYDFFSWNWFVYLFLCAVNVNNNIEIHRFVVSKFVKLYDELEIYVKTQIEWEFFCMKSFQNAFL